MGYRELSRMEIVEVVRRWQMGESQRAIARGSGVARETVKKYLGAAEELGLAASGPPPTEEQVVWLVQVGRVVSAPRMWASPQADRLEPYGEQITTWLQEEHLQLTRVQELLGQRGVHVPYTTLERFVWRLGLKPRGRRGDTVRMASTPPGEVAEMDFERLGLLLDPETGRRQWIWGLSIILWNLLSTGFSTAVCPHPLGVGRRSSRRLAPRCTAQRRQRDEIRGLGELARGWTRGCGHIRETVDQPVNGGRAIFDRSTLVVGERNLRQHPLQIDACFEQLGSG